MKFKLKATIPVLVFASLAVTAVQSSAPDRLGSYDFSYQSSGDQRVRPVQVFDDGRSTFFQFRAGEPIPAILAVTQEGPDLVLPEPQGPYVRVPTVAAGYVLKLGYGIGKVSYVGAGRAAPPELNPVAAERPQQAAAVGRLLAASSQIAGLPAEMTQPAPRVALEVNSYATPLKGDRTVWTGPEEVSQDYTVPFVTAKSKLGPGAIKTVRTLAATLRGATKIEITGRDDMTYREGVAEARAAAVADVLAAAGIPRSRIVIKTSSQVVQGPTKSVVVGASIVARTVPAPIPSDSTLQASSPRAAGAHQVDGIVAQLRSGQLSPSQAARALDGIQSGPSPVRHVGPWSVKKTDGNVESMLKRWGQEAGWRVLSKGAPTVEIHGDAEVDRREFLHAADYAITQAKQAGYRIKATAYSNNVLVLTGE